jgi:biotin synthase
MPNLTPLEYRTKYEIYPGKACINETAQQCNGCLRGRIASIGRHVGTGQGGRKKS